MPDLALLLRRLGLAALHLESTPAEAGGFSGSSELLAVTAFPTPMLFAVIAAPDLAAFGWARSQSAARVRCG